MSPSEKYGKRIQITFRITPVALDRLQLAAGIFGMEPGQYCKAVVYQHLQIFSEPLDMRKKSWQRKKRAEKAEDESDELHGFEMKPDAQAEDDSSLNLKNESIETGEIDEQRR